MENVIYKPDIIQRLMTEMVDKYPELTDALMKEAVNELLTVITETLSEGGNMEIRGFGTFHLRYYPARLARNPKSSEKVQMSGRCRLFFKTAKKLKLGLNASY